MADHRGCESGFVDGTPNWEIADVFVHLVEKENLQRAKVAKPRPSTATLTAAKKKSVLQRDQCCQFRLHAHSEICGSKASLQVDHIKPRWAGGDDRVENLRTLSAAHNRWKYQREAGIRRV